MEYVIELLENKLKEELIHLDTCNHILSSRDMHMPKSMIEAYKGSILLAKKRIPQLQESIDILKNSHGSK